MAPGSRLLAFASNWFDEATVARVFTPLVADWQREWQLAPPSRRAFIRVRGVLALAVASIVSYRRVLATPPPHGVMSRLIGRIATFVGVAALILSIPYFIDAPEVIAQRMPLLMFALIPSGVILALPFSMLTAVDVIRRDTTLPPHLARAVALRLAVAAVVFMILGHGWLVPAANQQFRIWSRPPGMTAPMPGLRELTTFELLSDSRFGSAETRHSRAGAIRTELNNRAAFAVLPAIFVWLRWIGHDVRKRRRFWPLPGIVMAIVFFVGFVATAQTASGLTGIGIWRPIVVAILIGVTQQWISARRRMAR